MGAGEEGEGEDEVDSVVWPSVLLLFDASLSLLLPTVIDVLFALFVSPLSVSLNW